MTLSKNENRKRKRVNMLLLNGIIGRKYAVEEINQDEMIKRRLQALGMTKGTVITILNNKKSGSVIFKVRGSRLAVGKSIASGITIREAAK